MPPEVVVTDANASRHIPSIVDRAPRGIADVRELVGRIIAIGDGLDDAVPVGGGARKVSSDPTYSTY